MMYTIALLATVVVSMSIEQPFVSKTVLAKEFRPVSSKPFAQGAQDPDGDWFDQIRLRGKGPNGCDFSDMEIASLYHLRLVEAHPKYIACQGGQVKTKTEPQLSRNMKRDEEAEFAREVASPSEEDLLAEAPESLDPANLTWPQYLELHPDYYEKEEAEKKATLIAVTELTKEFETIKASLPAISDGEIENLELYEHVKRQFRTFLLKLMYLDTRYDEVINFQKKIDEFSRTISNYNDRASDMCSSSGASYCVHFNQFVYHKELMDVHKEYLNLTEDIRLKRANAEQIPQSYKSRLSALESRYSMIANVELRKWSSFRVYYNTVLEEIALMYSTVREIMLWV